MKFFFQELCEQDYTKQRRNRVLKQFTIDISKRKVLDHFRSEEGKHFVRGEARGQPCTISAKKKRLFSLLSVS